MRLLNMKKHHKDMNISCNEVMNHICDHLDEDLDSPKCREIKEHIDECDSCQNYLTNIDSTIKFYRNYNVKLSEDAHNRLMEKLGLKEDK